MPIGNAIPGRAMRSGILPVGGTCPAITATRQPIGSASSRTRISDLASFFRTGGAEFSVDPNHPNYLEPRKRPFHSIIPGFLTKDGKGIGPFGVMQGSMQPQGHVQMVVNTVDYRMDPQTSLDQPRWYWRRERRVLLEPTVDRAVAEDLHRRGHDISMWLERDAYGRGQIIWRLPSTYIAGSDPRGDGLAMVGDRGLGFSLLEMSAPAPSAAVRYSKPKLCRRTAIAVDRCSVRSLGLTLWGCMAVTPGTGDGSGLGTPRSTSADRVHGQASAGVVGRSLGRQAREPRRRRGRVAGPARARRQSSLRPAWGKKAKSRPRIRAAAAW